MAEPLVLRAGPLRMCFENGQLRYLTFDGREVVRRIYAAVRDGNWGTVPGVLSSVNIAQVEDAFRVTFTCSHHQDEVDFTWQGTLIGDAQGKLSYHLRGAAGSTFWKNRIGICVLIPAGCAGAAARVTHTNFQQEDCRLPNEVSPNQPVLPFERLRGAGYQAGGGLRVELGLEGDLFELEDQRNWSDASFKIYGTPLRQPFPVEVPAGTVVEQTVTLQVSRERLGEPTPVPSPDCPTAWVGGLGRGRLRTSPAFTQLTLDLNQAVPLPEIGLEIAGHGLVLSVREIQLLRALDLGHLRVDLDLTGEGWEERLALGVEQSRQLGAALWLGLVMDEHCGAALARLAERESALGAHTAARIVLSKQEFFWGGTPLAQVLEVAAPYLSGALHASGTRADLIFLLRSPVPTGNVDAVVLRITPQVHAFDDEALVETLGAQAAMLRSARAAHPGAAVWVSPLSLRQGYNPYAREPADRPGELSPAGVLPENVDPRQRELFAAAWTAGSLAALAEGGAGAVTAYETSGWRGVMEVSGGSPLPDLFESGAGEVFPLYHILADAGTFRGGEVLKLTSSDALQAVGLGLRLGHKLRLIAAYFGKGPGQVKISGLPAGKWRLRRLDASRLGAARFDPQAYRAEIVAAPVREGEIALAFDGVGTVTLDQED